MKTWEQEALNGEAEWTHAPHQHKAPVMHETATGQL